MYNLSKDYTIIIVTHNMQQAARVSEFTAFFSLTENRAGVLMEFGPTIQLFTNPKNKITEDYITGRFGWFCIRYQVSKGGTNDDFN